MGVKRGTVDRVCSGTSYYRIGWPGQGPGKIARVLSWNRMLGMDEIQALATTLTTCKADSGACSKNNGGCNSARKCMETSSGVKCGDCPNGWSNDGPKGCKKVPDKPLAKCETSTTRAAIFDLDAAAQTSDIPKDSKVKMTFAKKAVKKDDTLPYWDLNKSYLQRTGGGVLTDGVQYTHAYVLKWRVTDSGWRTLLRHNQDHCIIVRTGAKDLGMYSNRKNGWRDSGYNIVPQQKYWEVVVVTGKAASSKASPNSHTGLSTLYTLDEVTKKMVKRGTVDRVCTGTTYYRIGWPGQGPGKIARVMSWNKVLGVDEIQSVANSMTSCKKTSPCQTKLITGANFDLNAAAQTSDIPKDSKVAMTFAKKAVKKDDTLPYWDLDKSYLQRTGGGTLKDGQFYTHAFLMKWRAT